MPQSIIDPALMRGSLTCGNGIRASAWRRRVRQDRRNRSGGRPAGSVSILDRISSISRSTRLGIVPAQAGTLYMWPLGDSRWRRCDYQAVVTQDISEPFLVPEERPASQGTFEIVGNAGVTSSERRGGTELRCWRPPRTGSMP